MRQIKIASLSPLNQGLIIEADERDSANGNASHEYEVYSESNPNTPPDEPSSARFQGSVHFQRGPIKEAGINGVSNEALIAIVIDRLQGFNDGQFRCRENSLAITHLEEAMHWLNHRTMERLSRNVEGTRQA